MSKLKLLRFLLQFYTKYVPFHMSATWHNMSGKAKEKKIDKEI